LKISALALLQLCEDLVALVSGTPLSSWFSELVW